MAGKDKEEYAILVVDDEETILDVAEGFFQRKGYMVHTASNGREALEILDKEKVHCCFTDISMPEMDGLELAEAVRKKDNTLPVVVMTGYPSLENTIQTLKNGVVDYLIKPINLEQMEITLKRVIRERSLFIENLILKEEVERQERLRELNNELISRVDEVNTINRIMEDFSDAESSYQIFENVVELGRQVLKADLVHFYIWTQQDHALVPVASAPASGNPESEEEENAGELISKQTLPFIRKVLTTDRKPCLVTRDSGKEDLPESVSSFMAVPLNIRDKVFGVASAMILDEDRGFDEKDIYYMTFITRKAAGAIENMALYENIYDNLFSTLYAFVATLEARDQYTREHSTRVAELAYKIARAYGCTEEQLDVINFAGRLHDIGKIGIRDDILLKPDRLTDSEYEKIKEHPAIGADIVGRLGLWNRERKIIRHHHERHDGRGYPDGLAGEEIPLLSRILSVADAYDAMASDRAYRKKMEKEKIIEIIKANSGSQFAPEIVPVFLEVTGGREEE